MKRRRILTILNTLIVVFEIIGIIHNISFNHRVALEYYTEQSNILILISSIIFLYYLITNKKEPNWLKRLKYASVVSISITFFVVLFILLPMSGFNIYGMFFDGTLFYHHLLCPLLSIISFIIFDEENNYSKKDSIYALTHTFIYGIVMVTLNILRIYNGPYPFLMVHNQTIIVSIMWVIIIFLLAFLISNMIRVITSRRKK